MDNLLPLDMIYENSNLLGEITQDNQQIIESISASCELYGIIEEEIQLDGDIFESTELIGELEEPQDLEGTLSIANEVETYNGKYQVIPKVQQQELKTKFKYMIDDVKVVAIPYFEVGNNNGGTTVYIADDLELE